MNLTILSKPEFYDIFGFLAFLVIISIAIHSIRNKNIPGWMKIILLLIGMIGLIVDGIIIYTKFVK